jgi:hypothetical protein
MFLSYVINADDRWRSHERECFGLLETNLMSGLTKLLCSSKRNFQRPFYFSEILRGCKQKFQVHLSMNSEYTAIK